MKSALSFSVVALGLSLFAAAPASALPVASGLQAPSSVELAAYGCGRGWVRTRHGHCRPDFRRPRLHGPRPGVHTPMYRDHVTGCEVVQTPRGRVRRCI
jgi:hypothetical protein